MGVVELKEDKRFETFSFLGLNKLGFMRMTRGGKVMVALHKSSSHVQMKAEKMIFHNVECILYMK